MSTLGKIFAMVKHALKGTVPPEKRIHLEFDHYDGDCWFYNKHMTNITSSWRPEDSEKARILLDDGDLPKLDGCPFIAKLGLSIDKIYPMKYCAFLYTTQMRTGIEELEKWLVARGFPHAEILTYGSEDMTGNWRSGHKVRDIKTVNP